MYCFPYPRDTDVEPIRAPLRTRIQYSLLGTAKFWSGLELTLRTENLKIDDALKRDRHSITSLHILSHSLSKVVQLWLFFGIASEVLGREIRHEEFAAPHPDGSLLFIDIRIPDWYWRDLKARWDNLEDTLTKEDFEAKRADLNRIYQQAQLTIIYMDVLAGGLHDNKFTEIILSAHMLLYVVAWVLDSKVKITQATSGFASTALLKRRMIRNGWCEKRLNFLDADRLFYPSCYFLSSIKPPRSRTEDHLKCSSEKCFIASSLSKPVHRTNECLCEDVVVPVDRVIAIVAAGRIPLIRITRPPPGKIELEVIPYTPSCRYIAISHVWADQQFGSAQNSLPKCQVGYLEEVISTIPTSMNHWGLRGWIANWGSTRPGEIAPSNRAYEYFWLDSFCIPQAVEHADLRHKAIESMNLIYAAASHTLVFDKCLQCLDAGRRPASLAHGGCPTYYSPQDEILLDVVAYLYASNWMGRAWTLQEAILSGRIVLPLHGSLAYLKLLWPHYDDGFDGFWEYVVEKVTPKAFKKSGRDPNPQRKKPKSEANNRPEAESEPFHERVREQLFKLLKKSLHVDDYSYYARTPAERAARFVKAHSLLQSRTTTQALDLPLILMNMSCLNANAISQSKTIEARVKQLYYGLESLPIELLFSDCARLGQCTVDAWIPREIALQKFGGKHTLKLGSTGFTFETGKDAQALDFYLLSSAHPSNHFRLLLPDKRGSKHVIYNVEALQRSVDEQVVLPTSVWCIVVDDDLAEQGARFVVNLVVGNKYFLHFDCPLRFTKISGLEIPSYRDSRNECSAVPIKGNFVIERSHEPQDLSISRPQNPEQYSDRLIVISQAIIAVLSLGEGRLIRTIWGDENSMGKMFYILYLLYSFKKHHWAEQALNAFVHRAWMATYQPDWDPNGCWKWFWKLSNWEPPIPFRTLMKWLCSFGFFFSFIARNWSGVAIVTLYWLPLFPKEELMNMFIIGVFAKVVVSFVF